MLSADIGVAKVVLNLSCIQVVYCSQLQVRNRTQEEIHANLSVTEAAERERQFFNGQGPSGVSAHVSEALRALPREKKGKKALIDLLLKVQRSQLEYYRIPLKKQVWYGCKG